MNTWSGTKLTKKETTKLLLDITYSDNELTDLTTPLECFILKTGQLLIVHTDGSGTLYQNRNDAMNIIKNPYKIYNPEGEIDSGFVNRAPLLVARLSKKLNLSLSVDDKDLSIIDTIDQILRHENVDSMSLNPSEYLFPIVIYCGQLILNNTSGAWIVLNDKKKGKKLLIAGSDGKHYDPYTPIMIDVFDPPSDFSLRGIVEYQMNPIKLE
jgi:hypothetical protein